MYAALSPGAIGVRAGSIEECVAAAKAGGFGGVEFSPTEAARRVESEGAEAVRALFETEGVRPAAFGLPTDWRGEEAAWRAGLAELPRLARAAARIGCTRAATWVMSCSETRSFAENRRFHVERFRPVAEILAGEGARLGLEFLGPQTLWQSQKYPFIHTMGAMLEMAAEIGPNVGLLLDSWHWHTSGGTLEAVRALTPQQVVYVHVNDAPAGVPLEKQVDNVRALPGETGVIDIAGFLDALRGIGYDGPVTPEPFKKELADLPSDAERLRVAGAAMDKIMRA